VTVAREPIGNSGVWFEGKRTLASIYERAHLSGSRLDGPAIIVQMDSTTAIPPARGGGCVREPNTGAALSDAS